MKLTIRKKILLCSLLPLLLLGLIIIALASTIVKQSIIDQVENSLKGTAIATQAAYDQNAGSYLQAENGDIWKGSYNISQSETLVDTIKKESGMDVTFFYGTERIMTSALDKNGDRILGSPAGDVVAEKVLKKEKAISATIFPWMARSITAITHRSIRRMILPLRSVWCLPALKSSRLITASSIF